MGDKSLGSSVVERFLGKEEVGSSILLSGSKKIIIVFKTEIMRDTIHLECTECKRRNYTASRNKKLKTERMEVRKYCRWDQKHTLHKETK